MYFRPYWWIKRIAITVVLGVITAATGVVVKNYMDTNQKETITAIHRSPNHLDSVLDAKIKPLAISLDSLDREVSVTDRKVDRLAAQMDVVIQMRASVLKADSVRRSYATYKYYQ